MSYEKKIHQGNFNLAGKDYFGELLLDGEATILTLSSLNEEITLDNLRTIHGVSYNHLHISCLQCISHGNEIVGYNDKITYRPKSFPHLVATGGCHITAEEKTLKSIAFTTDDLAKVFNDRHAFGRIFTDTETLKKALEKETYLQGLEIGESPHIFFYTGKHLIFECATLIGNISVQHYPSMNPGDMSGIHCDNKVRASIDFNEAVNIDDALKKMYNFVRMISVLSGRSQGIYDISLTKQENEGAEQLLEIHQSYPPTPPAKDDAPSPRDILLRPELHLEQFQAVLRNWLSASQDLDIPRVQYVSGLEKRRSFDPDRLVSAANLFDLLPSESVPIDTILSPDYVTARDKCLDILKNLPPGDDKGSAIGLFKRWGRANLRTKILHRLRIVQASLGHEYDDLNKVIAMAVKTRNYFVHGAEDFKPDIYLDFMCLFTETLEFIAGASDLVECGWNAKEWQVRGGRGGRHPYGYFLRDLETEINSFISAGQKA
jgi:hypothetical protein